MAKAETKTKTLELGDVATFEAVLPLYGLEVGETRTMKVTPELLQSIEDGLWKLKK